LLNDDTESVVESFLDHHGVKGQKWGIRNDKGHEGHRAKTKKIAKLDKRFEQKSQAPKTTYAVWNGAVHKANRDLQVINNKPEYKNKDFTRDSPLRQKYYKEIQSNMLDNLDASAKSLGTNASGTHRYGILETPDGGWDVVLKSVKHAVINTDNPIFHIKLRRDSMGHITSFELVNDFQHVSDVGADFLDHHGVKGQKWGIRNRKNRVKVPSSSEHKKAAALRKKPVHSLTNEQLKTLNTRGNLERQHSQLNPSKVASGKKRAEIILGTAAVGVGVYNLFHSPAGQAAISLGKKAARKNLGKHAKLPF
jgi:hypothetical protein